MGTTVPDPDNGNRPSNPGGVLGLSDQGEGVHGETNSAFFAAIAGISVNRAGTGAGIYGESKGLGSGGVFKAIGPSLGGARGVSGVKGQGQTLDAAFDGQPAGVRGINDFGHGVQGLSNTHIGVEGSSSTGTALFGQAT